MSLEAQEHFYGRKKKLELINRRVLDLKEGYRQNMAFLGERYVGKTAIIKKYLRELDASRIAPVYIDLENSDIAFLFSQMAGSLLSHYTASRNFDAGNDLASQINAAEYSLPETVRAIRQIQNHLSHNRDADAYPQIIDLPQIFAQEADVFCVLFFDEFQHFEDLGIAEEFKELGKRIMTQRRCLYIVVSSQVWAAQKILSEKLTLLFGNFEIIEIRPFDITDCREFLKMHLHGLKMGEALGHFLIDFTGGQPLYLTLICAELRALTALHRQTEIFLPILSLSLEKILNERWGVLNRHFDLLLDRVTCGKGNVIVGRILISLSAGRMKIAELADSLGVRQSVLSGRVNRLLELGIVAKNGNFFFIPDRVFRYWLKFVYQKRRNFLEDRDERQVEEFRREFSRAYEASCANQGRDISHQVVELLSCFENEQLTINGRRYKLPQFKEMAPSRVRLSGGGHMDLIRAASEDGEWIIILKPDAIGESEIVRLAEETRKIIQKPQRCVLISLKPLDENARIRAIQERMWIWNEGELNALAEIYDKSLFSCPRPAGEAFV